MSWAGSFACNAGPIGAEPSNDSDKDKARVSGAHFRLLAAKNKSQLILILVTYEQALLYKFSYIFAYFISIWNVTIKCTYVG